MKKRPVIVLGGILIAVSGVAAFVALSIRTQAAPAVRDPRQEPPIVRLATFRVPGKIVERLVNAGQQVKAGQPLMRIDGLYVDRRHGRRHGADPAVPSCALCRVVPDQADSRRYPSRFNGGTGITSRNGCRVRLSSSVTNS